MPVSLAQYRDLLLPGLWGWSKTYKDLDLVCNYVDDSLELQADGKKHKIITRKDIDDGTFKAAFAPKLTEILGSQDWER